MVSSVLVTGGAGYIGGHVVIALQDASKRVIILDDLSAGSAPIPGVEFVHGSILNRGMLAEVFEKFAVDTVIHLAAFVDVAESVRDPEKYYFNNTRGTEVLAEEMWRAGIHNVIFSSTAAVYGTPETSPVSENATVQPKSPYGTSKAEAELALLGYYLNPALNREANIAILRYFNVAGVDPLGRVGYRIHAEATHLIRRAVLAAEGVIPNIEIFGIDYPTHDGTAVRDYIHVVDIASVHLAVLQIFHGGERLRSPLILNVGYGKGYSVLEVIEAVKEVTGRNFPVEIVPRRAGDVAAVVADSSRLVQRLGWQPRYNDLRQIVRHEYEWVKAYFNR